MKSSSECFKYLVISTGKLTWGHIFEGHGMMIDAGSLKIAELSVAAAAVVSTACPAVHCLSPHNRNSLQCNDNSTTVWWNY